MSDTLSEQMENAYNADIELGISPELAGLQVDGTSEGFCIWMMMTGKLRNFTPQDEHFETFREIYWPEYLGWLELSKVAFDEGAE